MLARPSKNHQAGPIGVFRELNAFSIQLFVGFWARFQQLVNDVVAGLKARGISAEGVVKEGNAGKVIIEEAKEWDADLIVVGAHGISGLETLIMGNVARHVVDHAPCSVEVVRPKR